MPTKKIPPTDDGFLDELPPAAVRNPRSPDATLSAFADELRQNIGRWKRYPKPLTTSALHTTKWNIQRGRMASFPKGKFDSAVRDGVLYVRAVKK